MFLEDCKVIENREINKGYHLMKVKSKKLSESSNPGQFFMIKMKNEITILRRPISIHSVDKNTGIIEFYYEVKGRGSEELSKLKIDESINIQGPLGNGFTNDYDGKNVLVVGGGMGLAPLKYLIDQLSEKNNIFLIAGGRGKDALDIISNFNLKGEKLYLTTDDGSIGRKGNVIEVMRNVLDKEKIDVVISCGPYKMMELVTEIAIEKDIFCEISLEERMACGVKACVGCSIKTLDGMKKVCHDGPVFNGKTIVDIIPKESVPCSCN